MMTTVDRITTPLAQESLHDFAQQKAAHAAIGKEAPAQHERLLGQFLPPTASPVLHEARRLHRQGISPVPIKHASKSCFKDWLCLTVNRLYGPMLDQIFDNENIKVGVAAVVGRVSGNLFVVDADTPVAAEKMTGELAARGMKTWVRSSSRGAQFWFRCVDGEVENQPLSEAGVEILGRDRIAVAPGSIHPRTGEILEWKNEPLPPLLEVSLADMGWLGLTLYSNGKKRREKAGALPPVADRVLVEQDVRAYGGDNSRAEWGAIWSLMGVGFGDEEIASVFQHYAPPHYGKIGEIEWRRSDLHQARKKYEEQSGDGQTSALARLALRLRSYIESLPWPGVTGNTDRAVLVALTERMRLDNLAVFRGSQRELAVLAGMSVVTVGKSLKRISAGDTPWIRHIDNGKITGANRWSFTPCAIQNADFHARKTCRTSTVSRRDTPPMHNTVSVLHDLGGDTDTWHRLAMGKSAQALMAYLVASPDGAKVKDIAAATGKCDSTVKRSLAKLETHGIVHKDGNAWQVSRDADLAPVAFECGTAGKTEAKTRTFEKERQINVTRLTLDAMIQTARSP